MEMVGGPGGHSGAGWEGAMTWDTGTKAFRSRCWREGFKSQVVTSGSHGHPQKSVPPFQKLLSTPESILAPLKYPHSMSMGSQPPGSRQECVRFPRFNRAPREQDTGAGPPEESLIQTSAEF